MSTNQTIPSSGRRRNNNFDLLRLIAALLVIFSHAYVIMKEDSNQVMFDFAGNRYFLSSFGLMIFFTISGFLVSESVFNSSSLVHFVWKRVLRIYPAYIVITLLCVFLLGPAFTSLSVHQYFSQFKTWQFLYENLLIMGSDHVLPGVFNGNSVNASAWTLTLEIKLYLLLVLFSLTGIIRKRWLFTFFYFIFIVGRLALPPPFLQEHFHFDPTVYYHLGFFFLTGTAIFIWRDIIKISFLPILIAGCLWFLTWKLRLPSDTFEVIFFSYLILWIAIEMPVLFVPRYDISYGIYIYAWPVQMMTFTLFPALSLWQFNLITVPVITLFGFLSWHLIEKKALAKKNFFSKGSEQRNLLSRSLKA